MPFYLKNLSFNEWKTWRKGENAGNNTLSKKKASFSLGTEISIYHITTHVSNVLKPLQIFLSHTHEVKFNYVIRQSTVPIYSYAKIPKHS